MTDEPETFTLPLPPPPGAPAADVLYVRAPRPGAPDVPEREDEDIMLRRVPRPVAQRFRAAAGGRGLTHAQYLSALVALHEAIRARADGGDHALREELERLGLQTVRI